MSGNKARFENSAAIVSGGQMERVTIPSGFTLYTVRKGEIYVGRFIPLDVRR
ncbi:MAG: hypothetical protein ABJB66_12455 [Gemmatimonadaceae bacterium]